MSNNEESDNAKSVNSGGLLPNQVSFWWLVFFGIAGIAPMVDLFSMQASALYVQGALAIMYILAFIGATLTYLILFWYSRRIASARGYYGYALDGLGKYGATFTSYNYLIYVIFNASEILSMSVLTFSGIIDMTFHVNVPWWSGLVYGLIILVVVFYMGYQGIKPSIKSIAAIAALEVIVILIFSIIVTARAPDNSLQPFTPYVGWSAVFLGFIVTGLLSYGGLGSIISLGEESKVAHKTVGNAMIAGLILGSITFIFMGYAAAVGWGLKNMNTFATSANPILIILNNYIGYAGVVIAGLVMALTFYPLLTSFITAGSRTIFAMGRDKLFPTSLAKVNKNGSPSRALALVSIMAVAIITISEVVLISMYGIGLGILYVEAILGTATTIFMIVNHFIMGISMIFSGVKKKFGNLNTKKLSTYIIISVVSLILYVLAIYYSLLGITFPVAIAPIIVLVAIIGIIVSMAIHRHKLPELKPLGEKE